MKKILSILVILTIILLPSTASASSYRINYHCDAKQPLDDGTFYLTCHLAINSDMDINHVKGSLLLKNVKLASIKTNNDWQSLNGLNTDVEFTSTSDHKGSFTVADFVFTGNLSDTECEASYIADVAEKTKPTTPEPSNKVCAIVDDVYYGKNGNTVSEEKYYEECEHYTCTVVDNKYYFNSQGKSVSYDAMLEDCSTSNNPSTGINYGYIIIPIGLISLIGITKITKKKQKIYKI